MREHPRKELGEHVAAGQEQYDWQVRFENIIEKDVDAHLVISSEGRVLYANSAARKLCNYPDGDQGRPFEHVLQAGQTTEICLIWEGQPRVAEMRVVETEWDGRQVFLASVRDITRQHELEEAMRKSEARVRAFLEHAAEGVIVTDFYGCVQSFNPAAETIFGYAAAEINGKNVNILMAEPYRSKHDAYLRRYRSSGLAPLNGRSLEMVGQRKDGILFPVESTPNAFFDGEQHLFIAIVRDITFRQEAERELRLWAKVFETALSAVIITDAEGTIQTVSRSFTLSTGWPAGEVIGKNPRILKSGRHEPGFYTNMWQVLKEIGHWEGEIWNRRKTGETYPVWLSISASRDLKGRVTHYVGIFRDITADLQLRQEVILAGKIQKGSLRPDLHNEFLSMHSLYRPYHFVSGDFYDYRWDAQNVILHGFLLDVMGHGLATALQISALRVLFRQATEKAIPLCERMDWINRESIPYFTDGSFGAAICFDIDFHRGVITISSAGINYMLHVAHQDGELKVVTIPGLFWGISARESYDQITMPLQAGDAFIFLSDGLFDPLNPEPSQRNTDFTKAWAMVKRVAARDDLTDDATAMGIVVKSVTVKTCVSR